MSADGAINYKRVARYPKKRQARKPDNLDDRFKNPLLRVAVNRTALPDDWTPINRLDELWKYEGRCIEVEKEEEKEEKEEAAGLGGGKWGIGWFIRDR